MTKRRILTVEYVDGLKPEDERYQVHDSQTPGLHIEVTPKGARSFYWLRWVPHEGRNRRIRIGAYPEVKLKPARERAKDFNRALEMRKDPEKFAFGLPEDATRTVDTAWDLYCKEAGAELADRTLQHAKWQYDRHVKPLLGSTPIESVTKADIAVVLSQTSRKRKVEGRTVGGPVAANRVRALLSSLFAWAVEHGLVASNPVVGTKVRREKARGRYVLPEEMPRFLEAVENCENKDVADAVKLLLFTGQRVGDLMAAKWREFDLDAAAWTIPRERFKSRVEQRVPLTKEAVKILERRSEQKSGPWVFPRSHEGHRKDLRPTWDDIVAEARLSGLHPHDLRRTTGMALSSSGADHAVIVMILGHSTAALGVTARYATPPFERQRAALERAVSYMLAGPQTAEIVQLGRGKAS